MNNLDPLTFPSSIEKTNSELENELKFMTLPAKKEYGDFKAPSKPLNLKASEHESGEFNFNINDYLEKEGFINKQNVGDYLIKKSITPSLSEQIPIKPSEPNPSKNSNIEKEGNSALTTPEIVEVSKRISYIYNEIVQNGHVLKLKDEPKSQFDKDFLFNDSFQMEKFQRALLTVNAIQQKAKEDSKNFDKLSKPEINKYLEQIDKFTADKTHVSGIYNAFTASDVATYQGNNDLVKDGEVGKITIRSLNKDLLKIGW